MLQSIPVGAATFFHILSTRISVSLLTLFAGAYQTGIYSAAVRFPQSLNNIPGGIFGAVLPAMAVHQKEKEPVRRLFIRSFLLMIVIAFPLSALLYFGAESLIVLIYGNEYSESIRVLQITAWTLIPVFLGMAFSHVILSQKRLVKRLPWVTGSGLVVNLIACAILLPRFESVGAGWALIITELALAIGYVLATFGFLKKKGERTPG
jgi:O-antigen/teichoic acid export membrane protein